MLSRFVEQLVVLKQHEVSYASFGEKILAFTSQSAIDSYSPLPAL